MDYVNIMDEADQVNTSICPGISTKNILFSDEAFAFAMMEFTMISG